MEYGGWLDAAKIRDPELAKRTMLFRAFTIIVAVPFLLVGLPPILLGEPFAIDAAVLFGVMWAGTGGVFRIWSGFRWWTLVRREAEARAVWAHVAGGAPPLRVAESRQLLVDDANQVAVPSRARAVAGSTFEFTRVDEVSRLATGVPKTTWVRPASSLTASSELAPSDEVAGLVEELPNH